MKNKFNLVQDRDDDTVTGSIKRHTIVFLWLIVAFIAMVVIVMGAFKVGVFQSQLASQNRFEAISGSRTTTVTLSAMPGHTTVPAYDEMPGSGTTAKVMFSSGESCSYLDGPFPTVIGSNTAQLYSLRCSDNYVFVNSVYVDDGFSLPD